MVPQEVARLPVGMRRLWQWEYDRLRRDEGRGAKQAEALAWRIFSRQAGGKAELDRPKWPEAAVWRHRVWGGTPEWLPLLAAQEAPAGSGLRVDRRALTAVLGHWEERESDLLINLGTAVGVYPLWPLLPGLGEPAGWLRQLERREEVLWGQVEWTEAVMALMDGKDRARSESRWELVVSYQLDLSRRPVVLAQAELVLTEVWRPVAGYELGELGWL